MLPNHANHQQNKNQPASSIKPGLAYVIIIFGALIAFEIFNFSTTDLALGDMLGKLTFGGVAWSTILALAFCGIDFAGIARLFTPEEGPEEPKEVWYLFGAWLLAATMNAILTWWGVSMAITSHPVQSSSVVDPQTITQVVPVFVAIMVWVIRILIIGSLSLAVDRMLHPGVERRPAFQTAMGGQAAGRGQGSAAYPTQQPMSIPQGLGGTVIPQRQPAPRAATPASTRPGSARFSGPDDEDDAIFDNTTSRPVTEPTYHTLNGSQRQNSNNAARQNGATGSGRFR